MPNYSLVGVCEASLRQVDPPSPAFGLEHHRTKTLYGLLTCLVVEAATYIILSVCITPTTSYESSPDK